MDQGNKDAVVGERRIFGEQLAEWDGHDWMPVQLSPRKQGIAGSGSVLPAVARGALPVAQSVAESVATNPNVPRTMASVGRVIGGVAPAVGGALKAGPVGGLLGLGAAAQGAWAGGKAGWHTGRMMQNMAAPVASGLESARPYVEGGMKTLGGAQGVLDLAQMAEPGRQDIGVLGVGPSSDMPNLPPALLNLIAAKVAALLKGQ